MIYQNKVWVTDDIVDKPYQDKIQNVLMGESFSWYFVDDVTYKDNPVHSRPGFNHQFLTEQGDVNSEWHDLMLKIIDNSCEEIGFKYSNILNGRSFLQLPLNIKDRDILDMPHIDNADRHLVILYYVKDADGDTVILENHYENEKEVKNSDDIKIKKTIKPKKGRVVIFDGWYWHTAQQPAKETRCIINYNVN